MTINVNNQQKEIAEGSTVVQVLDRLQMVTNGIAVAVNNTVITKNNWETTTINANDAITVIQATQGG